MATTHTHTKCTGRRRAKDQSNGNSNCASAAAATKLLNNGTKWKRVKGTISVSCSKFQKLFSMHSFFSVAFWKISVYEYGEKRKKLSSPVLVAVKQPDNPTAAVNAILLLLSFHAPTATHISKLQGESNCARRKGLAMNWSNVMYIAQLLRFHTQTHAFHTFETLLMCSVYFISFANRFFFRLAIFMCQNNAPDRNTMTNTRQEEKKLLWMWFSVFLINQSNDHFAPTQTVSTHKLWQCVLWPRLYTLFVLYNCRRLENLRYTPSEHGLANRRWHFFFSLHVVFGHYSFCWSLHHWFIGWVYFRYMQCTSKNVVKKHRHICNDRQRTFITNELHLARNKNSIGYFDAIVQLAKHMCAKSIDDAASYFYDQPHSVSMRWFDFANGSTNPQLLFH